jgi:chorismate-pyruvate lyase
MLQAQELDKCKIQLLKNSLSRSPIELAELSTLQRIILITDGTLTDILEIYLLEKIAIIKLSEEIVNITENIPLLNLEVGSKVIKRRIFLQGRISQKNWIYAESIVVPDRLDPRFKDQLINSAKPIGKLWLEYRVETFKEIVDLSQELAGNLAEDFKINKDENLFSRTYRVFSQNQPVMMIAEKFPTSFFI